MSNPASAGPESSGLHTVAPNLTTAQQEQLGELLDQYLISVEEGTPAELTKLTADCPRLLEPLREYVAGLECLRRAIADDAGPQSRGIEHAHPDGDHNRHNGQVLGDFRLQQIIGRGGMGVVYRARQISLDREVAIKLLPVGAMADPRQIARFRNEAQAAACLTHPNIVPVYEVGLEQGIHFYAMQLIQGRGVDEVLQSHRQRGVLPQWRPMIEVACQAADALHAAHEMGIIHRDIKPSNLILDVRQKLWVTDFGLARYQTDVALTRSGDIVGTMRYMSPEQASGSAAMVDGRSDIFSLACTLYEMLTLRPVRSGEDVPEILRGIDQRQPPALRIDRPDLPRALHPVLSKAMSPSRDDRYATAKEFSDDLRRVLSGVPTVAKPPSVIDRGIAWASRHQRSAALASTIALLAAIGLLVGFVMLSAQKRESDLHALRAQRHEQLARDAVQRLGSQTAERLAEIPGADGVRRQLLAETLQYHRSFVAHADRDPELRRELALTQYKIGVLSGQLNDLDESITALRESVRIYTVVAEESPDDLTVHLERSVSRSALARALHKNGQLREARLWYRRAIEQQERLLARRADPSTRDRLAESLNNLGLLLAESESTSEAEEAYGRAIALMQSNRPSDDRRDETVTAIHSNLCGLLADTDPRRAAHHAEQALARLESRLQANPNDATSEARTVVALNELGSVYAKQNQHRSAVDAFARAIRIGRSLHQRWPDRPQYRRDLVVSQNQLGLSLSKLGELDQAKRAFVDALTHQRALADTFHRSAEVQSMTGNVLNNLGFLQRELGQNRAALATFREAIRFQSLATRLAPELDQYRQHLETHRRNLVELEGTRS